MAQRRSVHGGQRGTTPRAALGQAGLGQEGVVTSAQLLAAGWTRDQIRARADRDWQRVHRGVYATFSGPIPPHTRVYAAVLATGPRSAASHETALWLWRVNDVLPDTLHVSIPGDRRVAAPPGVRLHHRRTFDDITHPAASPPRTTVEVAVLDVAASTHSVRTVLDVTLRATQRRLTTASRLRADLLTRPRHRWRALLLNVLEDVDDGATSPLERAYLRGVERRHGLPDAERNRAERGPDGHTTYRDARYRRWRVVVELDGREAHPAERAFRDRARDNRAAVAGEVALRYGWVEVTADPCGTAAQVATVLMSQGWTGTPRGCGPGCAVGALVTGKSWRRTGPTTRPPGQRNGR